MALEIRSIEISGARKLKALEERKRKLEKLREETALDGRRRKNAEQTNAEGAESPDFV